MHQTLRNQEKGILFRSENLILSRNMNIQYEHGPHSYFGVDGPGQGTGHNPRPLVKKSLACTGEALHTFMNTPPHGHIW